MTNYYNQALNYINDHINILKKNYDLNNDDSDDLKYRKLMAHKIFSEQQAGRLETMFYHLINDNPLHVITVFEKLDSYPIECIPQIICIYINEFYTEHTDLINKLMLLNQYYILKYKTPWKYLDNENEKFYENLYEIIYKIENIDNTEKLQELFTEINNI